MICEKAIFMSQCAIIISVLVLFWMWVTFYKLYKERKEPDVLPVIEAPVAEVKPPEQPNPETEVVDDGI